MNIKSTHCNPTAESNMASINTGIRLVTAAILANLIAVNLHASPAPMEPAERTLFVLAHGVNPTSGGYSASCNETVNLETGDVKGKAGRVFKHQVWSGLYTNVLSNDYANMYTRSFIDPASSPVSLAHELGDRSWTQPACGGNVKSLIVEAKASYLHKRLADFRVKYSGASTCSSPVRSLWDWFCSQPGIDLVDPDFLKLEQDHPELIPSRVVLIVHSMGGLTSREYFASNFYNNDVDKLITFDSPHEGSWAAYYNNKLSGNAVGAEIFTDVGIGAIEAAMGFGLMAKGKSWGVPNPGLPSLENSLGMLLLTNSIVSLIEREPILYVLGNIAGDYQRNQPANLYLTPGSEDIKKLEAFDPSMLKVKPTIVAIGTEGMSGPDDPAHMLRFGSTWDRAPTSLLSKIQSAVMSLNRDYMTDVGVSQRVGNAFVAYSLASAGLNWSQHGSFIVPANSSLAPNVKMFQSPDVSFRSRFETYSSRNDILLDDIVRPLLVAGGVYAVYGLTTSQALDGLDDIATALPTYRYVIKAIKPVVAMVAASTIATAMGEISTAQGSETHNLALDKSGEPISSRRNGMLPSKFEDDLYEAPFVQIKSENGLDPDATHSGKMVNFLHLNPPKDGADAGTYPVYLDPSVLSTIEYKFPGWESQWAIKKEDHVAAQNTTNKVRQVVRYTLPGALLTSADIQSIDMQVDDLRPDLMESMQIIVNWGQKQLAWKRGATGGYTVTKHEGATVTTYGNVNDTIDRFGNWTVDLSRYFSGTLADGLNQISIALVNHAGKSSLQKQYINWQASRPVVEMKFPQPGEVISTIDAHLDARGNTLYYPGLTINPSLSGWKIIAGDPNNIRPNTDGLRSIPGLIGTSTTFEVDQDLSEVFGGNAVDGIYGIDFHLQSVQTGSKGQHTNADYVNTFYLDRTPPMINISASAPIFKPGQAIVFTVKWTDNPTSIPKVLELVRFKIIDDKGQVVAEPAPVPFAIGGQLVVRWDGKISGQPAPDGNYSLQVEARDAAVPSASVRTQILSLKNLLNQDLSNWNGKWATERDAIWNTLRTAPNLNWASASMSFRLDGTAPVATFDPLPTTPIGGSSEFRLSFRLADAGSVQSKDEVHVRLILDPINGNPNPQQGLDTLLTEIAPNLASASTVAFGETSAAMGHFPDGAWALSVNICDASGNQSNWSLGNFVIQRTPPVVRSLRADNLVVSSQAIQNGKAILDVVGATTVSATWIAPDGTKNIVDPQFSNGVWSISYPSNLQSHKGIWALETQSKDLAGNITIASTSLWVDLLPPRIILPNPDPSTQMVEVSGPIAIQGLAMDPLVDNNPFKSYSIYWRMKGDQVWQTIGMRVPQGRGPSDKSWLSNRDQTSEGLLGFWEPPVATGLYELRLLVDDGTGLSEGREDIREVYRTSNQDPTFQIQTKIAAQLGIPVQTQLGFDIQSLESQSASYKGEVALIDSRGAFLMGKDLIDLKASRFFGTPSTAIQGAFQIWKNGTGNNWHIKANYPCRSFSAKILTSSVPDLVFECPTNWSCKQSSIVPTTMTDINGGLMVNRTLEIAIPAHALGTIDLNLQNPAELVLQGDPQAASCSSLGNSVCSSVSQPPQGTVNWPMPQPGEVVTGEKNQPMCEMIGGIHLDAGSNSWQDSWNGFRPDGSYPAPGVATMEVDVWETRTGKLVTKSVTTTLTPGLAVLGAYNDGDLSVSASAPVVNQSATLHFTLQGRGAKLALQIIHADGTILRSLSGSGQWFEGRPVALPYTVTWDGKTDDGTLVSPGMYYFKVSEIDGTALSQVQVSVTSPWTLNPSLALGLTESVYDPDLMAYSLQPKPILHLETGISGQYAPGGVFSYAADYTGTKSITTFPSSRFSLMVNRRRDAVKFGILFRATLSQRQYDNNTASCGTWWGADASDVTDVKYSGVQTVEIQRGIPQTVSAQFGVIGTTSDWIYRFLGGPHTVEYQIVPLSSISAIQSLIGDVQWSSAKSLSLTSGQFVIDNNSSVTPKFGAFDPRTAVGSGTWIEPHTPYSCDVSLLSDFSDAEGKGIQSWPNPCDKVAEQDLEFYNPHRNLIRYNSSGASNNSYIWGGATSHCTGDASNVVFGFNMTLDIPQDYWVPTPGINNLANRFLRFDSDNKFLFGGGGYIASDDFDNDESNSIDDVSEQEGHLSIFGRQTYHWRPRLTDVLTHIDDCQVFDQTPAIITSGDGVNTSPGTNWAKSGSSYFCSNYTSIRCQEWRHLTGTQCTSTRYDDVSGLTEGGRTLKRPVDDPLYFYEGDHGRGSDLITAWFENTPQLGNAVWKATLRQGATQLALNSSDNRATHPGTMQATRGAGTGIITNNQIDWTSTPLDISVLMQGTLPDFQSATGSLSVPWPLNSTSWDKVVSDFNLAQMGSGHPTAKIFLAASGVRFGFGDGLAPTSTTSGYASSAQESFFQGMAAGLSVDPNHLPNGIPTGTGRYIVQTAQLVPNGIGSQTYDDPINFSAPPAVAGSFLSWQPSITMLSPTDGSITGSLTTMPGHAVFSGAASQQWTFASDPRGKGTDKLEASLLFDSNLPIKQWSLLQLYTASTGGASVSNQTKALFQNSTSWIQNPALVSINLQLPTLKWRTGDPVNGDLSVTQLAGGAGVTWPAGIQISRSSSNWGLPEWTPVHGSVSAGTSYQLGWTHLDGSGWVALGEKKLSTCSVTEIANHTCDLGYVNAAQLPAMGQLGIVVETPQGKEYALVPFVNGVKQNSNESQEVKSLWGDASVLFGPDVLTGKTAQERTISIRTIDPSNSGVNYSGNLLVSGPIVEILPSQSFSLDPSKEPRVRIKLKREEIQSSMEPTSLGLYKVDPTNGTVVPLSDVHRNYYCLGRVCDITSLWDVLELDGATASFSKFAVLPVGTKDSRNWSWGLSPIVSGMAARTISISGMNASELIFYVDNDPLLLEPGDQTPATVTEPTLALDGKLQIQVPVGTNWIAAVPKVGGLAKTVQVIRIVDSLQFNLNAPNQIVIGTVNGVAHIQYQTNHDGRWILAEVGATGPIGFVSDSLHSPGGVMAINGSTFGNRWSGTKTTRLTVLDVAGTSKDFVGPTLVGDAGLPWLQLSPLVYRSGNKWFISVMAKAGDAEGTVSSLEISIQTNDGRVLASNMVQGGSAQTQSLVDIDSIPNGMVKLISKAFDQGGNHVESEQVVDLNVVASHTIWWMEAENMAERNACVPICVLPSRKAVRSDSISDLYWTVPNISGAYVLGGRWRSADTASIQVSLNSMPLGTYVLPARRQWGDVETFSNSSNLFLHGGEIIHVHIPKGMEWDGLVLVDSAARLHGWISPMADTATSVQVWIRDEGVGDLNMLHPRFYVTNNGGALPGYKARIQVRTAPGASPLVDSWWPSPLPTQWETDGHNLWDLIVDRSTINLPSGGKDFQGDGVAMGIHYSNWAAWDRADDPSWLVGTPGDYFVTTSRVPVFDTTSKLISKWTCTDEPDWNSSLPSTPTSLLLTSSSPVTFSGQTGLYHVNAEGQWNWGSTYIGVTPLDGQQLTGTLTYNGQSWPLSSWWHQIQIPNTSHQDLDIKVELPTARRIQLQKWEN
jgi:flagellar hook assembly protein FlgD